MSQLEEYRSRYTVPASAVGQGAAAKQIKRDLGNDERLDLRWDNLARRWIMYYAAPTSGRYIVKVWQPCMDIGGRVVADIRHLQKTTREQRAMAQGVLSRQQKESDDKIADLSHEAAVEIDKSRKGLVTTSAIPR